MYNQTFLSFNIVTKNLPATLTEQMNTKKILKAKKKQNFRQKQQKICKEFIL